jgi:hypothetical protein
LEALLAWGDRASAQESKDHLARGTRPAQAKAQQERATRARRSPWPPRFHQASQAFLADVLPFFLFPFSSIYFF